MRCADPRPPEPGERVLAVGRGKDVAERGGGMPGWTFVMVTDRALRWIMHLDLKLEASLDLDSVTSVIERTVAHRYAIHMEHRPLSRLHRVPAHRFLKFEWGNDFANGVFTRTSIAFSRRDTAAPLALRERSETRGLLLIGSATSDGPEEPSEPSNGRSPRRTHRRPAHTVEYEGDAWCSEKPSSD